MPQNLKPPTLCWKCQLAIGDCSWSEEFVPVDGWFAEKTRIKTLKTPVNTGYVESYVVYNCPLFQRDPPKKAGNQSTWR